MVAACLLGATGGRSADPPPGVDAWTGPLAMELRLASTTRMPLLGRQRSVTTSLMLVTVERSGGGWTQRHRVCDVRVQGSSSTVRVLVPPAFVHALPAREYPAVLREGGDGVGYTADLGVEAIGYDPALSGGKLPERIDAPGVRDTDGDGRPGATIRLRVPVAGTADLYIVQRSHLVLGGREVRPGRIEGAVRILAQEQRTLGAEPGFFARNPSTAPDPARSGFTLVRAPGVRDCEGLRKTAFELFNGGRPPASPTPRG